MHPQQLTEDQLSALMRDLMPGRISSRKQGGRSLSYLEAYDVKAMLIRVFGFGGFSSEVIDTNVLDISYPDPQNPKKATVSVMVTLRLTIPQLEAVYTESAASSQTGSQGVGDVVDFAVKTAASDALKRAAIFLGTQFGLSLYNNGSNQEIVRRIVAPGQEWAQGQRQTPQQDDKHGLQEHVVNQETAEASPEAPAPSDDDGPAVLPAGNGLTDDQRAANQAVMDKLGRQTGQD